MKSAEKLAIYVPVGKRDKGIKEQTERLAKALDRSINWVCVTALQEYLEKPESQKLIES